MNKRRQIPLLLPCLLAARAWGQPDSGPEATAPATSCGPCHTMDRPTHGRAEVTKCLRVEPRGARPVSEGPVSITLSEGTGHYGRVVFSHQLHAEMANMGRGCRECHHEATEGRDIRRCGECHPASRLRVNLDVPDLRGAIHRQRMACREIWDPEVRCASCHAGAAAGPAAEVDRAKKPFAHSSESASPLTRLHRALACTTRHTGEATPRTLSAECASCHEDQTYPARLPGRRIAVAPAKDVAR